MKVMSCQGHSQVHRLERETRSVTDFKYTIPVSSVLRGGITSHQSNVVWESRRVLEVYGRNRCSILTRLISSLSSSSKGFPCFDPTGSQFSTWDRECG